MTDRDRDPTTLPLGSPDWQPEWVAGPRCWRWWSMFCILAGIWFGSLLAFLSHYDCFLTH